MSKFHFLSQLLFNKIVHFYQSKNKFDNDITYCIHHLDHNNTLYLFLKQSNSHNINIKCCSNFDIINNDVLCDFNIVNKNILVSYNDIELNKLSLEQLIDVLEVMYLYFDKFSYKIKFLIKSLYKHIKTTKYISNNLFDKLKESDILNQVMNNEYKKMVSKYDVLKNEHDKLTKEYDYLLKLFDNITTNI